MNSASLEGWRRVQEVFGAALECEPAQRGALLARECGADARLRGEVESLLSFHQSGGMFDELAGGMNLAATLRTRLTPHWEGRQIAQYSVIEPLAAGAMGHVYKARDERLGRLVALKFLPPCLAAQPEARSRFLLEARAAAVLDHPNICTIHEVGAAQDGQPFIAMALYDGQTLQARLTGGRLALADVLAIGVQIANGLAKAHQHGVVHRDVKPGNIMLLADGTVKILDFGVAWREDLPVATQDAAAIGTVAYMSPEQMRGDPIDARTDVWSLGVVLYEMLAGTRPFGAADTQALGHAVLLTEPPSLDAIRADLPESLRAVVRMALAKASADRYASMAQMAADLAALTRAPPGLAPLAGGAQAPTPVGYAGRTAGGERRRAAVLVTVLPDYLGLVEQLTPQRLAGFSERLRTLVVEVAGRHGGLANQIQAEEIVCVFGVPAAHEDDDLRAVRAAMELHARALQLHAELGGELSAPLALQSGVHSGLVVARRLGDGSGMYDVRGPAAQIAARLAALAPRNAIQISPQCRRLIAPFVDTAACAPVVLHAGASPTTPYRVIGDSGFHTRLEAAAPSELTPYAGRREELAALESLLRQARAGRGQVAWVVGEAGVGKSRLLHEFCLRIGEGGVRILPVRCHAHGGTAPYLPFIELLRAVLRVPGEVERPLGAEELAARVHAIDPALDTFVPLYLHLLSIAAQAHPLPRHLHGDQPPAAVPEALAAILFRIASAGPVLLLVEDWHWSDAGSREALRRLAEVAEAHALLLVVTSRPDAADLATSDPGHSRLQLGPLDFDNAKAIMAAMLHVRALSEELAWQVYRRTAGNPFFLEEICCALLEQGTVSVRDGEAIAAPGIDILRLPDNIQAVIRTRLDSLEPQALEVLRVASVIGRDFSHDLLAEVLGFEPSVQPVVAARLIERTGSASECSYRFKHVLTQEVTYDSLLEHQRRSLHALVGRAIEREHAGRVNEQAQMLAHHFGCAGAWIDAVHYGRCAAARAGALSQFADALSMLDRVHEWVLQLRDDSGRSEMLADVLLQQERLCETLGQRGRQQQIIDQLITHLEPLGPSQRLAQAYLRQGDLSTLLRRFDAADRALSTALRIGREHGNASLERHALRSLGLLRWHEERHAEALAITEQALAIDRERGDELAIAGDLANLGMILKSMGDYPRALASLEEALAIPAMAREPSALVYDLQNIANVHRALGNLGAALEHLQRADEISREHRLSIQRSFHLMAIAHVLLQQGQVAESVRTYEEAVALSRRARHADGLVQSLRAFGEVLFGLGRYTDALPCFEEAAALFAQLEDHSAEAEMWTRRAAVLEALGEQSAFAAWTQVRALRLRLGDAHGELDALEGIARASRRRNAPAEQTIGHLQAALALAATLSEERREAALRNTLGILEWERGHYSQALIHYERVLALVRELGERSHEGLALNSLGVTLVRLKRTEEARTVFEQSICLNRQTGEQLLEAHALAALGDLCAAGADQAQARRCFEQSFALRRMLADRGGEQSMLERLERLTAPKESADATLHH